MPQQAQFDRFSQEQFLQDFRKKNPELDDMDDEELMSHLLELKPQLREQIITPDELKQQAQIAKIKTDEAVKQQELSFPQRVGATIKEPVSKQFWAEHPGTKQFSKAALESLPLGGAMLGGTAGGAGSFGVGSVPGTMGGAAMGEGIRGILSHYLNLDNNSVNQQVANMGISGAMAGLPVAGGNRYLAGKSVIPTDDIATLLLGRSAKGKISKFVLSRLLKGMGPDEVTELANPNAFGRNILEQRGTQFKYGRLPEPFGPQNVPEGFSSEATRTTSPNEIKGTELVPKPPISRAGTSSHTFQVPEDLIPKPNVPGSMRTPTGTPSKFPPEVGGIPEEGAPAPKKSTFSWGFEKPKQPYQWGIQNQPVIDMTFEEGKDGYFKIKTVKKTGGE